MVASHSLVLEADADEKRKSTFTSAEHTTHPVAAAVALGTVPEDQHDQIVQQNDEAKSGT